MQLCRSAFTPDYLLETRESRDSDIAHAYNCMSDHAGKLDSAMITEIKCLPFHCNSSLDISVLVLKEQLTKMVELTNTLSNAEC